MFPLSKSGQVMTGISKIGPDDYSLLQAHPYWQRYNGIFFSHFCYPDLSGSTIYSPKSNHDIKYHFKFVMQHDCKISFSGHGHPEGCIVVHRDKMSFMPFGKYLIEDTYTWVVVPCTAKTTRPNGVTIFDTKTYVLEVIQLKSSKIIVDEFFNDPF